MLHLQFFRIRTCPYYLKQVAYSRAPKLPIFAYAAQHNIQTAATPREVLGVSQDADLQEIKTAFRKLALKLHPDRETGSESEFIEVLRAYEILVGKADGKEGLDGEDWDFHDWFWRFSMNRSRNQGVKTQRNFRTDFSSQLAGLRQRAAVRAAKQRAEMVENPPNPELENQESCCDDAESPSDSGTVSEDSEFSSHRRSDDEARRRSDLNSSEVKESISQQLTGLKRRSQIRQSL